MDVSTAQSKIAELAAKHEKLTALNQFLCPDLVRQAVRLTRRDGALGVDGKTADDFASNLEANIEELISNAKSGRYRAPPVRRALIPKGDGSQRPLGIPTYTDKVLQRSILMILEPIYEGMFLDCSYGFRPGRRAHDCIRDIRAAIHEMGGCFVLDVDIKKYFDSIPISQLRELVRLRVQDGVINRLIAKELKAGVMERGGITYSDIGTPQGGVLSPLLANIFLHYALDTWMSDVVAQHVSAPIRLFRYADDFVVLVKSQCDAERVMIALERRLAKFGLRVHPGKTQIVDFRPPCEGHTPGTFNFLGFTFSWGVNNNKRRVVRVKTARDRFTRSMRRFNELCKKIRHIAPTEQWQRISRALQGHYAYYNVAFNQRAVWGVRYRVSGIWHKWLNRRDQKGRVSWERFTAEWKLLFPLPQPSRRKLVPLW